MKRFNYFIPAWYKKNKWCENEQNWHSRRQYSEFDETIKQIQLFHRNLKEDYKILLMSYSPNFRHFLHRQGIYRANYWSCFDSIQQVTRKKIVVLSFHDLKWPQGIEFVYSPFAIIAFLNGQKYAKAEFGEDGNLISVDMYADDVICRRNYYDDRGFVSNTIIFTEGKEYYQDFLGEDGIWRIRNYFGDGHVEINQRYGTYTIDTIGNTIECSYSGAWFPSLESVLTEILEKYVYYNAHEGDKFFVALYDHHMSMMSKCLEGQYVISTLFENRFSDEEIVKHGDFIKKSRYLITDSKDASKKVKNLLGIAEGSDSGIIRDISPYDARTDMGISQQLSVQNIMLPIDGIGDTELEKILIECSKYLKKNSKARIHVFTRNTEWNYSGIIKNKIAAILEKNGFDRRWVVEDKPGPEAENMIDIEEEKVEIRFFIDQTIDERNISKCVNEQRVILDLRKTVDVFLFITAISKGVPRISLSKDEFLLHKRSGYQLRGYDEISQILSYYLDSMEVWNEALIENYELGQKFTTDVLIQAWKEVLEISG